MNDGSRLRLPEDVLTDDKGRPYFVGAAYGPEDAAAHARVMAWLKNATPEEVFQSSVEAGIYSPDGQLLPPYADEESSSSDAAPHDNR
jgi:hypothetical protein